MLMEVNKMSTKQEHVVIGTHYETGQTIELSMKNGFIQSIKKHKNSSNDKNIIAPGLVDIQMNGYMGTDFNDHPLSNSEWEKVIHQLTKVGITTFYPTIITNSYERLAQMFKKNVYCLNYPYINQFIGGFHLEGPYISMKDGPR